MTATIDEMTIKEVLIEKISVNPHQPRRHFSDGELDELADSIKEVGLIHPPLVRPLEEEGHYELISGERRYRASQRAGLKSIPVIIRESSDSLSAQQALVENIQRVDLNPLEIAKALKSLLDEFNLSQDELAQRIGKKRSTVANYLRLLSLPRAIQESISSAKISMGHAKAILSLSGFEKQALLHDLILRDDLNVREAEQAAQRIHKKSKKKTLVYTNRDFYLEQLSEKIQHRLGTKVNIAGKGKKGRISIDYYSLDDLDRLLAIFGIDGL
ncbi:MAG: ParB/RepB/Spo0J family partition protein [Chlamydiota bacterium]|nr:ParB/RepB/Spo0J family partition protein [Chlamydiota bacterium]